jgi:DHA1 family tetracycline resistance protein-like MFS transporter
MIGPILFTQTFAFFIAAGRGWHLPGAAFLLSATLLTIAAGIGLRMMATRLKDLPEARGTALPSAPFDH